MRSGWMEEYVEGEANEEVLEDFAEWEAGAALTRVKLFLLTCAS